MPPTAYWSSSPTARRTIRSRDRPPGGGPQGGGRAPHRRRGGGAGPTRIPIRDSTGALVEYKRDDDGSVIQTQRRDDILRAVADAAEGTLIPSEARDQAGAVRDLVAAFKRSPTSATQTADLVPRAWIPGLAAALLLLAYTIARPGPALVGLAGCSCWRARATAQRPTAGVACARGGRSDSCRRRVSQGGRPGEGEGHGVLQRGHRGALGRAARRRAWSAGGGGKSLDPGLRYRALYNLGLASLLSARADTSRADEMLDDAADQLRQALLLQPGSARAKWNLELAERRRPPPPPQGGGGGGGGPRRPPADRRRRSRSRPSHSPRISRRARRSRS